LRLIKSIIQIAYLFALLTLVVGLSTAASAQQPFKAEAFTDTNQILIGDQVTLILIVTSHFEKEVLWPVIGDTITSSVEVVSQTLSDTLKRRGDGSLEIARVYKITSFDSGFFVIPPFSFVEANDSSSVAETEAILITVHTMEVDTSAAIKDIKAPLDVPYTWDEFIPHALVALCLFVLCLIIYFIYKKLKNRPVKEVVEEISVGDPFEIAIESLQILEGKRLWQQDKVKVYYTELTDIIRTYIENRFGVIAMEMTTDEIMESMNYVQVSQPNREKLGQLLMLADMVKFAKSKPIGSEHEMSLVRAFNFVRESKPVLENPPEALQTDHKLQIS